MKLRIQKFNPLEDAKPYYVEGEVAWREGITALDAIYLFHTQVTPVNFDYSCGGRVCGRCGVMIDGEPKLMCFTLLSDGTHTIEPLKGYDIIRDLVVDRTDFDKQLANLDYRVMIEPVTKETEVPEDFDPEQYQADYDYMDQIERCARCGLCQVNCAALTFSKDNYIGPAAMLQIALKDMDFYDKADRVSQAVSAGLYHCILCGKCDEVCPMLIPHVEIWQKLRAKAEGRGLVPSYAK